MAFPEQATSTPAAIADISIQLYSPDPLGTDIAGASYSVQVRYSDNSMRVVTGDLVPHLSQAQINGLLSFMADMRVKAVAEILP